MVSDCQPPNIQCLYIFDILALERLVPIIVPSEVKTRIRLCGALDHSSDFETILYFMHNKSVEWYVTQVPITEQSQVQVHPVK